MYFKFIYYNFLMDIDIEKTYTTEELIDCYYDNKIKKNKKISLDYNHNNVELGIPLYNENYTEKYNSKSVCFKNMTSSILYILGLGLYIYQIFNYHNQINYIIKQPFGVLYGYFIILYPIIFSLSIVFMIILQKKRKLLFIYDIAIFTIIISGILISPIVKNFYGKYLLVPIITLLGSIPFIIIYICIPTIKIMCWLIL